MKLILKRLSLCSCGFPILKKEIPLGTEYEPVSVPQIGGFKLICGGCGNEIPVKPVYCKTRGNSSGGFLPMEIFQDEPAPSIKCPVCGAVSYNAHDIEHGYCGRCHDFTSQPK